MRAKTASKDDQQSAYRDGRAAREGRKSTASCPYGLSDAPVLRSWWLAGRHDEDIEQRISP